MRKFVDNYLGVILFYLVLAGGAMLINCRFEAMDEKNIQHNQEISNTYVATK